MPGSGALLHRLSAFAFSLFALHAPAQQLAGQLLPTGMRITPLAVRGTTLQPLNPGLPALPNFVAGMGVASRISPDGKTLLVVTAGYNQNYDSSGNTIPDASNEYVFVYDISGRAPRQTHVLQVSVSTFEGLEWNPNGKAFYVSGGPDDLIHVFSRSGSTWIEGASIQLNHNGVGLGLYGITPIAAGLAVTDDGRYLLAANFQNDSVSFVDLSSGSVAKEFDLRPGKINAADSGKPGGSYPYAVAVAGRRAYITSQRDREVVVLDFSDLNSIAVPARVALVGQPNKVILNHARTRVFVALDNSDAIGVIDTRTNTLVGNIQTIAPKSIFRNPGNLRGASPNNLAVSADDRTLYVTNGGTNSLAVISLGQNDDRSSPGHLAALIPTAWYPTAVSVSPDQSTLYVVNGKSQPGPNPGACIDTNYVNGTGESCYSHNQYIYQIMQASLATIPIPHADDLPRLTRQVARNNHFSERTARDSTRDLMAYLHGKIRHVIYVVKENKTYDQVLGDLERGNGDPSLNVFPEAITPNHHGLARQFVTLDNTYCSGEVSGDGWNWSGAARVTDSEQKTIQLDYAARANIYDYDGTNRYINVGYGTVAERQAANPETPDDPDLLAGQRDVDEHDGSEAGTGYLWDSALRAHLTVRNYGFEFIDENRYFLDLSDPNLIPPMRSPFKAGVIVSRATKPSLMPNTDPYFFDWDMDIPDYWLFKEWEREFDNYAQNDRLPSLELIALPHDHFGNLGASTVLDGVNTIETQMADNDYALGLLVQKVAHSKYRDDTVIFVIEDDAQDGPDHIDAHRTIAYAIGAYVKQGAVISTRYSTVNMLRTIEDLLGMQPLGLNDGLQPPMADLFTRELKKWDYQPIVPPVLRTTTLPLPPPAPGNELPAGVPRPAAAPHDGAYWAAKMRGFDFKHSDHLDPARFNRILWEGLKGESVPYPTRRTGQNLRHNRKAKLARPASVK